MTLKYKTNLHKDEFWARTTTACLLLLLVDAIPRSSLVRLLVGKIMKLDSSPNLNFHLGFALTVVIKMHDLYALFVFACPEYLSNRLVSLARGVLLNGEGSDDNRKRQYRFNYVDSSTPLPLFWCDSFN
jgi:hypothetical protein